MTDAQFTAALQAALAHFRAGNLWFHGAHHVTVGAGFQGDHKFYAKVYQQYEAEFDLMAEKAIAMAGVAMASPQAVSARAAHIVSTMPAIAGLQGHTIGAAALQVEKQTLTFIEKIFRDLEGGKRLSLGMNDFLAAAANAHETNVYKLGQRVSGGQAG